MSSPLVPIGINLTDLDQTEIAPSRSTTDVEQRVDGALPYPRKRPRVERSNEKTSRNQSELNETSRSSTLEADGQRIKLTMPVEDYRSNEMVQKAGGLIYDNYWTEAQEKAMRDEWSVDDDFMVARSSPAERRLFIKSETVFGIFPASLIPDCVEFGTSNNSMIRNPATGTVWEHNPNWSSPMCNQMFDLMSLPCFEGNANLFRFIVLETIAFRLALDERRPSVATIEFYLHKAFGEVEQTHEKPYWNLYTLLQQVVQAGAFVKGNASSCHFQHCDMKNISAAWDLYAKSEGALLPAISDLIKSQMQDRTTVLSRMKSLEEKNAYFYAAKKEQILAQRRKQRKSQNAGGNIVPVQPRGIAPTGGDCTASGNPFQTQPRHIENTDMRERSSTPSGNLPLPAYYLPKLKGLNGQYLSESRIEGPNMPPSSPRPFGGMDIPLYIPADASPTNLRSGVWEHL